MIYSAFLIRFSKDGSACISFNKFAVLLPPLMNINGEFAFLISSLFTALRYSTHSKWICLLNRSPSHSIRDAVVLAKGIWRICFGLISFMVFSMSLRKGSTLECPSGFVSAQPKRYNFIVVVNND